MTRTHLIRLLITVALVLFAVTILITDHAVTAGMLGLGLGYVIGMPDKGRTE